MLGRSFASVFGAALALVACEPKPAEPATVLIAPVDAATVAVPAVVDAPSAPPASSLELHPGQGGPCARDDECAVTNASPDCCACCGLPPRAITKVDLLRERNLCATMKVKCAKCDALCKPVEAAESWRPVCVDAVCRAARR